MTSIGRPVTSAVYVMVLRRHFRLPLVPLSDEENKSPDADKDKAKEDKGKDASKGEGREKSCGCADRPGEHQPTHLGCPDF